MSLKVYYRGIQRKYILIKACYFEEILKAFTGKKQNTVVISNSNEVQCILASVPYYVGRKKI